MELNYDFLVSLFGWMSVINLVCLLLFTLFLTLLKPVTLTIHTKLLGIKEEQLELLYIKVLAYYKLTVIVFVFSPYLALKAMAG